MAWANKYLFKFKSIHGVEYSIYILQDGYSGSVIQRALGRAPILRKKKNGSICGTSLEIYAECSVDGEFTEFYTSDPKEYRVDLYRANTLIWSGFISPELYSEPSIAPPYDVQIVAVDGLGELKLHQFIPQGVTRVKSLLAWILEWTGKSRGIVAISSLGYTNGTAADFLDNVAINLDFMAGESCYNVLETLLRSLHATITTYEDKWLIVRETDLSVSQDGTIAATAINTSGVVSSTTIASAKKTVGKMGVADAWPIQNLSTKIEPALSKVTMLMPWHLVNFLDDPKFEKEPAQSAWVAPPFGTSVWVIRFPNFVEYKDESHEEITFEYDKPVYWLNNYPISDDRLYQQRQLVSFTTGFRLTFSICSLKQLSVTPNSLVVNISFTPTGGSPMYYLKDGWSSEEPSMNTQNQCFPMQHYSWEDYSIDVVPPYVEGPGTLKIEIRGHQVIIREATILMSPGNKGYKDTLVLNNGARGSGEDTELIGGRMLDGHVLRADCAQGIFLLNGAAITSYHDSRWSNADFLSITALGYAYSSALPRIRTEGKIDVPSGFSDLPLIVGTNVDSIIETYDWDLYNEEATISALSLPTGEITVEHETVEEITGTSGSADTGLGSGSSSGGGGGSYGDMFFELDLDHTFTSGKRAVKLKDEYEGLWSPGFVDSGGIGSGGGGGGGADITEVWASLQNTATDTTRNDWKLSTAHLPTLGAGLAYTDNADSGESLATTLSIANTHYLPTTQEWAGVASNLEGLQAMQAQLDALATRDNFDELTATAFFADVAAVSELYAGAISLNGQDVGTLLNHGETAYGWGDHAQAGYFAASSFTAANIVSTLGTTAVNRATADASGNNIANTYATATALNSVSGRVTTLESRQNWDEIFGIDSDGNVYIKKQTVGGVEVARGFWNYGFVDSGGAASGGGGGGGADITEVWASLQNTATDTSRNAWKFSTAHLPTLGAGLTYTDNADSGAGLATSLSIASTHYLPTAQEWAGVASNLEGLQAMQAQLDALASRDNFDELTATAFFADVAAVSALYAYSIELNGADLETTLSGKQATISDLSTIRSRADEGHTAYGWGNHANAGYFAASSFTAANIVSTLGTTAVNRATADAAGENIADNFSTVSKALQSLQAQLNSVATRSVLDELSVANLFTDTLAASKIFAEAIDFGGYVLGASGSVMQWNGSALFSAMSSSAGTNLSITVGGQNRTATLYATYDSASENISDKFGIVSTALQSLQKQIDSVAAAVGNSDEIYAGCASFDTLAVGSGIYAGSLLATGYVNSGASASSSDARLKSNIEEISAEKAVSLLMKLRGVEWDWNEKKACLEGRHGSGLVAQEVEKVMPWMVLDLNGELSLTYSSLWGVAIPVMQSHEERIAALERENAELKKQLNTITH